MTRTSKCIESALDVKTHFKPSETFQYTEFTTCHPPGVKRGFIKREAFRINFEEKIKKFKANLIDRSYREKLTQETL